MSQELEETQKLDDGYLDISPTDSEAPSAAVVDTAAAVDPSAPENAPAAAVVILPTTTYSTPPSAKKSEYKSISEVINQKDITAATDVAKTIDQMQKDNALIPVANDLFKFDQSTKKYDLQDIDKIAKTMPAQGEEYIFIPRLDADGKPVMKEGVMIQDIIVFKYQKMSIHIFDPEEGCCIGPETMKKATSIVSKTELAKQTLPKAVEKSAAAQTADTTGHKRHLGVDTRTEWPRRRRLSTQSSVRGFS